MGETKVTDLLDPGVVETVTHRSKAKTPPPGEHGWKQGLQEGLAVPSCPELCPRFVGRK